MKKIKCDFCNTDKLENEIQKMNEYKFEVASLNFVDEIIDSNNCICDVCRDKLNTTIKNRAKPIIIELIQNGKIDGSINADDIKINKFNMAFSDVYYKLVKEELDSLYIHSNKKPVPVKLIVHQFIYTRF